MTIPIVVDCEPLPPAKSKPGNPKSCFYFTLTADENYSKDHLTIYLYSGY